MSLHGLHPVPRRLIVLREQLRSTGIALRHPASIAAVLLVIATALVVRDLIANGRAFDFHPERHLLPGVLGLLFPIVVWSGRDRFGSGFLWTLPVERRAHMLARVIAGGAWLLGAVGLFVAWMFVMTWTSGGKIFAEETLLLLDPSAIPSGVLDTASVHRTVWWPSPWMWLVPFTASAAAYLLASAFALGVRRPLRWILGVVLGLLLVQVAGTVAGADSISRAPERLLRTILGGPYGFDTLLTARTETLRISATLSSGEHVVVWRGLPRLGEWTVATLLWMAVGTLALWAATLQFRESR